MSRLLSGFLAVVLLLPAAAREPCAFSVGPLSFDGIVGASEAVVLAHVVSVKSEPDSKKDDDDRELKYATADVVETWKGSVGKTVVFRASAAWTCDISGAVEGETAVLFLGEADPQGRRNLVDSGRGRMPVREVSGSRRASLWTGDVVLAPDTPTFPGPEPKYDFIQDVDLATLKSLTTAAQHPTIALDALLAASNLVVLARAGPFSPRPRFRSDAPAWLHVTATVVETWKGETTASVQYRLQPSWPTDLFPPDPGHLEVLFLGPANRDGVRDVLAAQRGRMPVATKRKRDLVVVWTKDVTLPESLASEAGPNEYLPFIRYVELARLKQAVEPH